MSVANILRKIGDWTRSKELVENIVKELGIVEMTAYRKMKKEVADGLIKKIPIPGRGVLYGLPNWPLKEDKLKLLLDIWNTHIRDKEANAAQVAAMTKLLEETRLSQAQTIEFAKLLKSMRDSQTQKKKS
jgi:hypothetical protein